jgi:hypothetical protein
MLAHQRGIRRDSAFATFCDGSATDPISAPTTSVIRGSGPVSDLPVAGIIRLPNVVVVNPSLPSSRSAGTTRPICTDARITPRARSRNAVASLVRLLIELSLEHFQE